MPNPSLLLLMAIGLFAGIPSGVLAGVQHIATGTSLAFILTLGFYLMFGAFRRLGWI